MDLKQAGSSLNSLVFSFNARIFELQEIVIARNSNQSLFLSQNQFRWFQILVKNSDFFDYSKNFLVYPATSMPDLSNVDWILKVMESQIQSIKNRLQEERNAIPKVKVGSPQKR